MLVNMLPKQKKEAREAPQKAGLHDSIGLRPFRPSWCCISGPLDLPFQVTRPRRISDPSPPAQAPESPYFSQFEAELGEMRENGPRQPHPRGFPRVTTTLD